MRRPLGGAETRMKLGYFTMPVHPPARSYVETLKEDREAFILADRLGYSEGYCGEHLTDAAENIPNSLMFIATLLGVTSQMKVGTAVVNLPHSHPVVVASNAAMLDNLFEGRFILGIGAGVLRSDAEALGLLDADRNAMFAEAIDHILALWAGTAPIDLKGKYWNISTVKTIWPEVGLGDVVKPYQKPHPPIAGTATDPDSKGLIALGRRGWWPISSHFLHPNCLKSQWANYAKGCVEGGHKPDRAVWRIARSIFVAEDDKVARAYGGDDPNSPYRFYMSQLTSKLKKARRMIAFKPNARDARRGHHLRLHLQQHHDPRQREPRRRPHPRAARACRRLRHAALLRQGLGRPGARPQIHGADGGEGHARRQRRAAANRRRGIIRSRKPSEVPVSPRSQEIKQSGLFGFLAQPDAPTKGGVVILPTIFGVNAFVRGYAETLARAGLAAAVWDHYEGLPLTTDYEELIRRARASSTTPACRRAVERWIDYMAGDLQLTSIGVLGFCLGGRSVLITAAQDKRVKACAAVYPSIDMPRQPNQEQDALAIAADIRCPVARRAARPRSRRQPRDLCHAEGDAVQARGAHDLAILPRRRARLHASQCAAGEPGRERDRLAAAGRLSHGLPAVTADAGPATS